MDIQKYEKLLAITLDQLERAETEIVLLKYDKQHLQQELAKAKELSK